jgi:hypothetical protein
MPVHTMTKLPSDSFWPTVPDSDMHIPYPKLTTDSSSSIISPLTLPRGVAGYFDHVASGGGVPTQLPHQPRGSRVYSPLSPGARGPAPRPTSFLSPHFLPSAKQGQLKSDQHRSSSVPPKTRNHFGSPRAGANGSPTGKEVAASPASNGRSPMVNGFLPPRSLASAAPPRSVSVDAASAPSHDQAIQRLVQQNARIREAWEAERKYLEANRERVEEVYKEERALMEEERAEWDAERAALLQEIGRLHQALGVGGGSSPPLNGMYSFSSLDQRGGGSQGTSRISPNSSLSSERASQPGTQSNGQVTRNGNSSLPMAAPRILDLSSPRSPNGPSVPTPDFLKPAEASDSESEPVPIVDVNEIHPELEGIPIKATSVKKATFTDTGSPNGSKTSSLSSSPPAGSDQQRSPRVKKEQTLQVLAAKETERLTMHAGHTPNHSLSSLATAASSGTATATSNGGSSTPTMPHEDGTASQNTATAGEDAMSDTTHTADPLAGVTDRHDQPLADHPELMFEPADDPKLKGPLMVRNMPAHDEIFFQKLSDKLEEVRKDNNAALPAVLKDSEPAEKATNPARRLKTQAEGQPQPQHDTTGSDAGSEGSKSTPKSGEEEGLDLPRDVPLKFKKRMNFGAPFGEIR